MWGLLPFLPTASRKMEQVVRRIVAADELLTRPLHEFGHQRRRLPKKSRVSGLIDRMTDVRRACPPARQHAEGH